MWLVDWLPTGIVNWATYLIIFSGIACYVVSKSVAWIPMIKTYMLPLELVGILIYGVGTYLYGGLAAEQLWKARVAALEIKVAAAEAKSQEVNTVIQEKIVTQIKYIKKTVYVNREIIKEVAAMQLDSQCTLPVSTVSVHNSASRNEVASGPSSTDGTPSTVKASDLLGTVVDNYGTCNENAAKVSGWQAWYAEQKKIFEQVK